MMALRIRCHRCRKRISIDEAFAGGYCRCPYCKAITWVPGGAESPAGALARPERPSMPPGRRARPRRPAVRAPAAAERPEAPSTPAPPPPAAPPAERLQPEPAAAPEQAPPQNHEAVPVANPVVIQGVVAMILLALLLLLVGGATAVYFAWVRPSPQGGPQTPQFVSPGQGQAGEGPVQPGSGPIALPPGKGLFELEGPRVAGMKIAPPVVYVVDGSSGMMDYYDPAGAVVRYSIRSLGPVNKFNVVLVREGGLKSLSEDWLGGGEGSDKAAQAFFQANQPSGATDLALGVRRALESTPKTMVLLTDKPLADEPSLAEEARKKGTAIFTVSLGGYPAATQSLKELAEDTGGQCQPLTLGELQDEIGRAPPLP